MFVIVDVHICYGCVDHGWTVGGRGETVLREWSLITGRGGLQNGRGGAREVLPLRKGGAEKVLAMLKGGHKKFWGRLYAVA